jgi:hypothetical protein
MWLRTRLIDQTAGQLGRSQRIRPKPRDAISRIPPGTARGCVALEATRGIDRFQRTIPQTIPGRLGATQSAANRAQGRRRLQRGFSGVLCRVRGAEVLLRVLVETRNSYASRMPYNGYAHNLQASPIEGSSRRYRLSPACTSDSRGSSATGAGGSLSTRQTDCLVQGLVIRRRPAKERPQACGWYRRSRPVVIRDTRGLSHGCPRRLGSAIPNAEQRHLDLENV